MSSVNGTRVECYDNKGSSSGREVGSPQALRVTVEWLRSGEQQRQADTAAAATAERACLTTEGWRWTEQLKSGGA